MGKLLKNKKIFLFIIFVIALFSFNYDVEAIICDYTNFGSSSESNNLDDDILRLEKSNDTGKVVIYYTDYVSGLLGNTDNIGGVTMDGESIGCWGNYYPDPEPGVRIYTCTSSKLSSLISCTDSESCCPTLYFDYHYLVRNNFDISLTQSDKTPYRINSPQVRDIKKKDEPEPEPTPEPKTSKCTDEQINSLLADIDTIIADAVAAHGWNDEVPTAKELSEQGKGPDEIEAFYKELYKKILDDLVQMVGATVVGEDDEGNPTYEINITWTGSGKNVSIEGGGEIITKINEKLKALDCEVLERHKTKIRNRIMNRLTAGDKGAFTVIKWKIDRAVKNAAQEEYIDEQAEERLQKESEKVEKTSRQIVNVFRAAIDKWIDDFNESLGDDCHSLIAPELIKKIKKYMNWIRIIVPILLIVLGTVDFAKAVLIQEERNNDTNKAFNTFIKRCVIAVAIFFVPTILHILVDLFNEYNPSGLKITDLDKCIN